MLPTENNFCIVKITKKIPTILKNAIQGLCFSNYTLCFSLSRYREEK